MLDVLPGIRPSNQFERFEQAEICQGIHQRFEKQVERHAQLTAIKDPERTFTYESLNPADSMSTDVA